MIPPKPLHLWILKPHFQGVLALILLLLTWPPAVSSQGDRALSIADLPDYNKQSNCGKNCMWWSGDFWVGRQLDCGKPYINDCFCREDKAPAISSHATSCLDRLCTAAGVVQNDINTFLSIYNSYCLENGYTLEGKGNVVPTTSAAGGNGGVITVGDSTASGGTITRVTFATVTGESKRSSVGGGVTTTPRMGPKTTVDITSTVTVVPTSGASGGDEGGLSRSDKVAIGLGLGIGLPATIAGLVTCCIMMARRG